MSCGYMPRKEVCSKMVRVRPKLAFPQNVSARTLSKYSAINRRTGGQEATKVYDDHRELAKNMWQSITNWGRQRPLDNHNLRQPQWMRWTTFMATRTDTSVYQPGNVSWICSFSSPCAQTLTLPTDTVSQFCTLDSDFYQILRDFLSQWQNHFPCTRLDVSWREIDQTIQRYEMTFWCKMRSNSQMLNEGGKDQRTKTMSMKNWKLALPLQHL